MRGSFEGKFSKNIFQAEHLQTTKVVKHLAAFGSFQAFKSF